MFTGAQFSRNSLRLAFFAVTLLWLWLIALVIGLTSWSMHGLLVLGIAIGFISLEQKTRIVSAGRRLLRNVYRSRTVIRLGIMTRRFFLRAQRIPIHVVIALAYLLALFWTALYLLFATN